MNPMKNLLIVFVCCMLTGSICGCAEKPHGNEQTHSRSITPMSLPEKTFHQSPTDYNRFAVESYLKIIRGTGDKNAVFSPFSLSMVLEILYAGSNGDTTRSLESILHLPESNNDLPQNPALFEYTAPDRENPEAWENPPIFLIGNSIWYSDKLTLNRTYETDLKKAFFLDVFPVDVTNNREQVARNMEQWANRVTQGLIPSINPESPEQASFSLLSVLYFKAHWKYKFQTYKTKNAPFTLANGKIIKTPTMNDEESFPYMENEELRALEMPYFARYQDVPGGGDFSMLFILPKAVDGIPAVEEKLSAQWLQEVLHPMKLTHLEVSIPKFRLEQEHDLLTLFDDKSLTVDADFSDMFTPSPVTDAVSAKQKIVLGIDEHGTEAAVATGIAYACLGSEPPKFIADHPFLFLIRETKSGTILFIGRVMNPNER